MVVMTTVIKGGPCRTMVRQMKLPPGWYLRPRRTIHAATYYQHSRRRVCVGESVDVVEGRRWHHVSISHPSRVPNYDDLVYLKRHWIGEDRRAVMIFPEKSNHVNIHPFCLHLFCCLDPDGDGLPEFREFV